MASTLGFCGFDGLRSCSTLDVILDEFLNEYTYLIFYQKNRIQTRQRKRERRMIKKKL
jgi:hypothetical protein